MINRSSRGVDGWRRVGVVAALPLAGACASPRPIAEAPAPEAATATATAAVERPAAVPVVDAAIDPARVARRPPLPAGPRVSVTTVTVDGLSWPRQLDPAVLTASRETPRADRQRAAGMTVRRSIGGLKFCYERQLARDPTLAGRLGIALVVQDGAVVEATITDDALHDAELCACFIAKVSRWTFDPGASGPIAFSVLLAPDVMDRPPVAQTIPTPEAP